jgi:hypothetical protein
MKKNHLVLILAVLFFGFGILSMIDSAPPKKEKIYTELEKYLPYQIEKRVGGFTIIFKDTGEKVKPTNKEFFEKVQTIDTFWAQKHLKLQGGFVEVLDDNKNIIAKLKLANPAEKSFVENYFGVKE